MPELSPDLFDPKHESRYQEMLSNEQLNPGVLTLLEADAAQESREFALTAPGESLLYKVLAARTADYFRFLSEALYHQAIPVLSPAMQKPGTFRSPDNPVSLLTRGFGAPRLLNPRLVALKASEINNKKLRRPEELRNMARIAFVTGVRVTGKPQFEGVVEAIISVRESERQHRPLISCTYRRPATTAKAFRDAWAYEPPSFRPDSEDDDWLPNHKDYF